MNPYRASSIVVAACWLFVFFTALARWEPALIVASAYIVIREVADAKRGRGAR